MSDQSTTAYTIFNYIVDRLAALGARHVFTVPGNYNGQFLMDRPSVRKIGVYRDD